MLFHLRPGCRSGTKHLCLTAVISRSLGVTVGIITGQMLGSGCSEEEVRTSNRQLTALSIASGVFFGILTAALSKVFPMIYNTTDVVRLLATQFIVISSIAMPLQAYIFPVYFTLRAGGKTMATIIFDSGAVWALNIPLAFILSRYTGIHIVMLYSLCTATDIIRCIIGNRMVKKGDWIQNLTTK